MVKPAGQRDSSLGSRLLMLVSPGSETPMYPVADGRMAVITHTFRHIY
jgi:hypothetical protein